MPEKRIPEEEKHSTIFHIISRSVLGGSPFQDAEKDEFIEILTKFSRVYFVEIHGFCMLGNHFHLLVKMLSKDTFSDDEIKSRYKMLYGGKDSLDKKQIRVFREKWTDLSHFMKDIKQSFSRFFNKKYARKGTLWGERFKKIPIESPENFLSCLAFIDLHPIRSEIVDVPEDYRWSSIGHHLQKKNEDRLLTVDMGIPPVNANNEKEWLKKYRRYIGKIAGLDGEENKTRKKSLEKME